MKIDMYQQVPEEFHSRLMETLDRLPEEKKQKNAKVFPVRKWLVLGAAAVLALGAVTVTAAEIFQWQRQAKERFGVSDELADELTLNGVTREENTVVESQGLEIRLLQSVRTEDSCYYLCRLSLPEGISVNPDIVFENISAEADVELGGLTADVVADSENEEQMLLEIQILLEEGINYTGQSVTVHLSNLAQTEKTEITQMLLEGNWNLPLTLLGETETVLYQVGQKVPFGEHELLIEKVQASPFELRVYMDQEEAQHALTYYQTAVTGVRNVDGSVTDENGGMGSRFGYVEEEIGAYYCQVELEQAIDPAKVAGLIFNDGEMEISFLELADDLETDDPAEEENGKKTSGADVYFSDTELPEKLQTLYERYGHEIVTDGKGLYIHDVTCGTAVKVLDLTELSYDQEKGGEIVPFGRTQAYILPYESSDVVYVYGLTADQNGEHLLSSMPAEETLQSESYQSLKENMLEMRARTAEE